MTQSIRLTALVAVGCLELMWMRMYLLGVVREGVCLYYPPQLGRLGECMWVCWWEKNCAAQGWAFH